MEKNKIINLLIGIIFSFFVSACSVSEIKIPANILDQKEMTSILSEIHIAQASITSKARNDTSGYKMDDYINYILKKHKIDKKDFLQSLKFYSDNPEVLQQVYDSVITGLSKIQGETEK